jgi:hypothetical protein
MMGAVPNGETILNPNLTDAADAAHRRFVHIIEPFLAQQFDADEHPAKICHFTDFAGLQGILSSRSLWATYALTLNDATEQEHGRQVIKRFVDTNFKPQATEMLREAMKFSTRSFVCCFCEKSDLLTMWTSYAQRGGGYCLEFDASRLLGSSFPPIGVGLPFKMTYGDHIPAAVALLLNHAGEFAQQGLVEASVAATWIEMMAHRFKHPAFIHECERRIVIRNPPVSEMKFRAGNTDIKPYVELRPLALDGSRKLPLQRVVFGPTLRHDAVLIEAIEMMLEHHGFRDVPVVSCDIPYRL